jgi:hypothetical protein
MPYSTASYTSFQDISGYTMYSDVLFADDGDPNGIPGYDLGSSDEDNVGGFIVWQEDYSDGLDTGNVATSLTMPAGGGTNAVEWSVANGADGPLYFTRTYGAIRQVQILAGVALAGCKMTWNDVQVQFYKSGTLIETISPGSVVADGTSSTDPISLEQITTVTPTANNNDMVVVSANVRLQANSGIDPGEEDIFGAVYVFTN